MSVLYIYKHLRNIFSSNTYLARRVRRKLNSSKQINMTNMLKNFTNLISGKRDNLDGEDAIHVYYEGNNTKSKRERDTSGSGGCCCFGPESSTDAEHTCCQDVWGGFFRNSAKGPERECSAEETYQINFSKVFAKQFTSIILCAVVVWFMQIRLGQGSDNLPRLFDCDPDSATSIIVVDGIAGEFDDDGVSFCNFKSSLVVVSFLFLFPFLLETFSVLTIIWVSSINSDVLVPVVDGKYVGQDKIFNEVFSTNVFRRSLSCFLVIWQVPAEILRINADSSKPVSKWLLITEMVWKFAVFMFPDIALTFLLFPVSYFVMISSDSPEDVLVNLVAVQIFAELDDIFVKMLFSPRSSAGERVLAYVNENPNADRATYSPFQAYTLNENRHEMGIKVKELPQMKKFHDYTGHHLTS